MFKSLNKLLYKAFNSHDYVISFVLGCVIGFMPNLLLLIPSSIIFIIFILIYRKSKSKFWSLKTFIGFAFVVAGVFISRSINHTIIKWEHEKCFKLVSEDEQSECLRRMMEEYDKKPWYLKRR